MYILLILNTNIQTFNMPGIKMYDWVLKETGIRIEFFHSPIKTGNLDIFAYLQTLQRTKRIVKHNFEHCTF